MARERVFRLMTETITLSQLLKAADIVGSGAEAKVVIAEGGILVNDEPETRRGRKLRSGDRVDVPGGPSILVE